MEITLNSKEINQALIAFVSNKMKINSDQKIQIEYKAGRGENGPTASIIIGEDDSEPLITEVEEKSSNVETLTEPVIETQQCNFQIKPIVSDVYVDTEIEEDDL